MKYLISCLAIATASALILSSCRGSCNCVNGIHCANMAILSTAGDTLEKKEFCGGLKYEEAKRVRDSVEKYKGIFTTDSTYVVNLPETRTEIAKVSDVKPGDEQGYSDRGYDCTCSK